MPSKKKGPQASHTQEQRFQRPWELGDPTWESIPTTRPEYIPWLQSYEWKDLEITLDTLRQGELWLSGSLRALAQSVNDDCHARDELVYQTQKQAHDLKLQLESLGAEVRAATVASLEQSKVITHLSNQLEAIMSRLTVLENQANTADAATATAALRQDISDQLLKMGAVIGCRARMIDVTSQGSTIQERVRAAQEVAFMRSPISRSVAESRGSSPAPSMFRGV